MKNQDKPCWIVGYAYDKTEEVRWNKIVKDHMGHGVF